MDTGPARPAGLGSERKGPVTQRRLWLGLGISAVAASVAVAAIVPMTMNDFHLPGTQVGDVSPYVIISSTNCSMCHGMFDSAVEPHATWRGSLMANAGRDPLFYAQMATANQDVENVGYFCMRCHMPAAIVSGHALDPSGESLDDFDREGVSCHFCHSMVDPIYKPGVSPPEDESILAGLTDVPSFYANAMFVLDPTGTRRGPRLDAQPLHDLIPSPFHRTGEFCGTCHDVGNVAVTLLPNGTYRYNALDTPAPSDDPWTQFPLERTYTEWKLSAFANGGVDMEGRFGGEGVTVVSSCQDCHMPRAAGRACVYGPDRKDVAKHDFAGAAVSVLDMVLMHYAEDPAVDPEAIAAAKAKSIDMLERAASLELEQTCNTLRARVINNTGHKLPTGHIEGRRVWINVRFFDASENLVSEYGHYDDVEAHLDEDSTTVYEMIVGLSDAAAKATGLSAGPTGHMALADTIVKDNRIPPRGFSNATYVAGGAPVVGATYADGQYWDDAHFALPANADRAEVRVFYQNLPRHYIEHLKDANFTNHWGNTLHQLWEATGKGPPNLMAFAELPLDVFMYGDINCDGAVNRKDLKFLLADWGPCPQDGPCPSDFVSSDTFNPPGDGKVDGADLAVLLGNWGQ